MCPSVPSASARSQSYLCLCFISNVLPNIFNGDMSGTWRTENIKKDEAVHNATGAGPPAARVGWRYWGPSSKHRRVMVMSTFTDTVDKVFPLKGSPAVKKFCAAEEHNRRPGLDELSVVLNVKDGIHF